jgi:hypothetical protein
MGFPPIILSWGVIMALSLGEIAVYGPTSYVSFMNRANGSLCR